MTRKQFTLTSLLGLCLLGIACAASGCGTVSGFASDLRDASIGVRTAFVGDDPDSPAND